MRTIGIDIGTTTISGVLYDHDEKKAVQVRNLAHGAFIKGKEYEKIQDPAVLINGAEGILKELLAYGSVDGIGLTGQMHGIVYLDENGQAVSPLYTWQDGSGNQLINNDHSMVDLINAVCPGNSSGYGLVTCAYHQAMGMIPSSAVTCATIMDYLGMCLTGRKRPLVHFSNAASFGFWKGTDFDHKALQAFHIDHYAMDITPDVEVLGTYQGIPVTTALGDNQASFLGAAGTDGRILLNLGTGGQISVRTDKGNPCQGVEMRPYLNGEVLMVGASLCGGRAYAILENFLREYVKEATGMDVSQYGVMERLAEKNTESSLQVRTTFSGTRTDPDASGSITGITENNFHPGDMIRGFEEGMIRELYDMYLETGADLSGELLYLTGNGLRKNPSLQKLAGEIFGMKTILVETPEEAACGAALSVKGRI